MSAVTVADGGSCEWSDEGVRVRHVSGRSLMVPASEMRFTFSRSSGPGGQAVNKLNTRAELRVNVDAIEGMEERDRQRLEQVAGQRLTQAGEVIISSDVHRSQRDNRRECVDRFCELLGESLNHPKKRKRTRPSRAAVEERLKQKREVSEKKRRRRPPET